MRGAGRHHTTRWRIMKLVPDGYWQLNLFLDRRRQAKASLGVMAAVVSRFADARENSPGFGGAAALLLRHSYSVKDTPANTFTLT